MTTSSRLTGVVTQFDARRGLGEITDNTGQVWPFHCAVIADGSRSINVGESVTFTTAFHVVRDEAFDIQPQ
ncbi:MAG: hypothetical protein ACK45J_01595 [Acidimicrobiaceae bacterium]|jgi:hypothetical protein|nr:cold shock domain-containing protein [Ilumatobacteraceae bacterium]